MQQYATSQEAIRAFIAGEGDGCRDSPAACQRGAEIRSFAFCLTAFSQIQQAICVPRNRQHYEFVCGCLAAWKSDGTIADMISRHIGNR
jgi:polar amino acid transport system substrate-binding protein